MNETEAQLLAGLPNWAFASVMLVSRVGGACILLPGIGEAEVPTSVRLSLVLALVAVLLPSVQPIMPAVPDAPWRAAAMIACEVMSGLWFGWLARLWLLALPLAGQVIASMIGIANVLQPDPMLGPQTSALSRALGLAAPVVLLASGAHAQLLSALVGSYALVPPGTLLPPTDTLQTVMLAMSGSFALSLQLAAPFIFGSMLWQIALGLLARMVPQLQVYFAAMPGQILGGLVLVGLLGGTLLAVWLGRVQSAYATLPG